MFIPQLRRAVADDEVEEFYFTLCEKCFKLLQILSYDATNHCPQNVNFFARLVGDETMSRNDIEAASFMVNGILWILCMNVNSYLLG